MDPAEKQGIVDGSLTFFGALGGGTLLTNVAGTPGINEAALLAAGIAGVISGLQSYRRAANLPTPPAPAATP
jgi:hypothetical protein